MLCARPSSLRRPLANECVFLIRIVTLIVVEVSDVRWLWPLTFSTENGTSLTRVQRQRVYQFWFDLIFSTFFVFFLKACKGEMDKQTDRQTGKTCNQPVGRPHNKVQRRIVPNSIWPLGPELSWSLGSQPAGDSHKCRYFPPASRLSLLPRSIITHWPTCNILLADRDTCTQTSCQSRYLAVDMK